MTGTGAALDAASRGLSVALVEARDLGSGTSSRSSKLIHGGLRYLEQLDFGLVHEALHERGLLTTRLAPHLVRPVPILVPLPAGAWRGSGLRAYYGAGVALYDAFAGVFGPTRGLPLHRHLTAAGVRRIFPSLRAGAVGGAIRYYDAQVDDARLVTTLARTAASLGAAIVTSTRAMGFRRAAREVTGATVQDLESGETIEVSARTVIAATGVWSDDVAEMLSAGGGPVRPGLRVRASKGVHLVVPRSAITGEAGLILRTATSVLFVIPWGGHWIIGTTDTDWRLDRAHPAASAQDISYLLSQVNEVLDQPLSTADIEGVYAGLRPLLSGEDEATSALSREHAVVEPMLGLMLVAGGKLTTYRVMAADVVDRAARRLGNGVPRSRTDQLPLLGADAFGRLWSNRADLARRHNVSAGVTEHLLERYGSVATGGARPHAGGADAGPAADRRAGVPGGRGRVRRPGRGGAAPGGCAGSAHPHLLRDGSSGCRQRRPRGRRDGRGVRLERGPPGTGDRALPGPGRGRAGVAANAGRPDRRRRPAGGSRRAPRASRRRPISALTTPCRG